MFSLLTKLKNLFIHPGYNYLLHSNVVVGLPIGTNDEYELWVKYSKGDVHKYAIEYDGECPGFTVESRGKNTKIVEFHPHYFGLWFAELPEVEPTYSLYNKTQDVMLIRSVKFIRRREALSIFTSDNLMVGATKHYKFGGSKLK